MVMLWAGDPSGSGMLSHGAALGRAVAELGGVRLGEFPPSPDLTGSIPDSPRFSPEAVFNPSQLH